MLKFKKSKVDELAQKHQEFLDRFQKAVARVQIIAKQLEENFEDDPKSYGDIQKIIASLEGLSPGLEFYASRLAELKKISAEIQGEIDSLTKSSN